MSARSSGYTPRSANSSWSGIFSQEVQKMRTPDRRQLVRPGHGLLSIRRQCELLGIARSGIYWPPAPANDNDLALMRRIDELFTAWPFSAGGGWRRCCRGKSTPSIASALAG
jgi:hypothetical protein